MTAIHCCIMHENEVQIPRSLNTHCDGLCDSLCGLTLFQRNEHYVYGQDVWITFPSNRKCDIYSLILLAKSQEKE